MVVIKNIFSFKKKNIFVFIYEHFKPFVYAYLYVFGGLYIYFGIIIRYRTRKFQKEKINNTTEYEDDYIGTPFPKEILKKIYFQFCY